MFVELWDLATGKKVRNLRGQGTDEAASLAFSPDGSLLAAAANSVGSSSAGIQKILLWNLQTAKLANAISAPGISRVQFSPDGKLIAWESCGDTVCLLDSTTAKEANDFAAHKGPVLCVAYSPDGKLIATGGADGDIRLWDAKSGAHLRVLGRHKDHVNSVAFSLDGRLLASGSTDTTAAIWDVEAGRRKRSLEGYGDTIQIAFKLDSVGFSPDGKAIAACGNGLMAMWSVDTGKSLLGFKDKRDIGEALVFLPDGKSLATGGEKSIRIWDWKNAKIDRDIPTDGGEVRSIAVSADGKYLAAGCGFVWELNSGKQVMKFPGSHNRIGGLDFSRDGRYLAFASDALWGRNANRNVQIWETGAWKELKLPFAPPLRRYHCLAFSPDGKRLVTGSEEGEAIIWEVKKE